jgi:hypothetical protein
MQTSSRAIFSVVLFMREPLLQAIVWWICFECISTEL